MPDVKQELIVLLSKLDDNSIVSLARNVTHGLKRSETRKESIENIIKYSPDELSILRKKVVTRDILFSYIEDNHIKIRLPVTKNELIDAIADFWNLPRIGSVANETEASCTPGGSVGPVVQKNKDESSVNLMANEFAKWFYSMLNENECGTEHFFSDARLRLNMYVNEHCETTEVDGDPKELTNALLKIRLQHNLHFNPNDTIEGIQGRMDPHGLVMVLACGTLHVSNVCAGVFEQVFALARDPFSENNWKIKNTELNLRAKSNVLASPRLCDSELTSGLLMLPYE